MNVRQLLKAKRADLLRLAEAHGARNIRLFGSALRDEAGPDSDIDLLVQFDPDRSLLDHVGLLQDLEKLLGRRVDVVSESALHWFIRDRVLEEAQPL